jgi:hypothetical protein
VRLAQLFLGHEGGRLGLSFVVVYSQSSLQDRVDGGYTAGKLTGESFDLLSVQSLRGVQDPHIDFSQHGRRCGSCANCEQIEHFSRDGIGPISVSLDVSLSLLRSHTSENPPSTFRLD